MNIDSWKAFWALVTEVWQEGLAGVPIGDILTALGILLLSLWVRNLFTRFVIAGLQRAAARSTTNVDDRILAALHEPIRFIPVVIGLFFATISLELSAGAAQFVDNLNRSLVAFTLFWALYRMAEPATRLLMLARGFFTLAMVDWLAKVIRVAFIVLGAATILELWGIKVGPILAGLGLFGVAVALGAQDLFKNLIAGLFVIGEQRFNVGDWILVDGVVEGTVEQIGFRTTMVRRFDKAPVFVPNSRLADNAVTNFSRMTHRRIHWIIGVEYRTSVAQLRTIRDRIEGYVLDHPDFAQPSEVSTFVRIDAFSDSSIDILLYCFTRTTKWGEWLEIKERLACEIKAIVEGAGAGFAFPSRSLYLENPEDLPEVFEPAAADRAAVALDSGAA